MDEKLKINFMLPYDWLSRLYCDCSIRVFCYRNSMIGEIKKVAVISYCIVKVLVHKFYKCLFSVFL